MTNYFIKEIVSGGQTGVDRAALDVAIKLNIPHGGWCPYQRKAEDGIIPMHYKMKEAEAPTPAECLDPNAIYNKRTELNVKDSDGTLIIIKDAPIGGTLYTIEMAKKHEKPYLVLNLSDDIDVTNVAKWIMDNNIRKLNVAGPRASQSADIYDAAYQVLEKLM